MEAISESEFRSILGTDEHLNISCLSDASLCTEDGCSFDVHRVILAIKNDYFRALFCSDKDRREVCIPGVSGKCLSEILGYLYTGRTYLTDRNISDIMVSADYLLIEELFQEVKEVLLHKLTVANSLLLLLDAHMINCVDVYRQAFRFMEVHFDVVLESHGELLAELPLEVLEQCLSSKSLHISDERPVWLAVVKWVQNDIQKRLPHVPLLLNHLASEEIDERLADEIITHSIVANNPHCKISNCDKLQSSLENLHILLRGHSNQGLLETRNPLKLHVFVKYVTLDFSECQVYVTYDDNLDLWWNIVNITDFYVDHIILIAHKLYIFGEHSCKCLDLKENNFDEDMSPFTDIDDESIADSYSVVKSDQFICVINDLIGPEVTLGQHSGQVYDHQTNTWRSISTNFFLDYCKAVTVLSNVYVFGSFVLVLIDGVEVATTLLHRYDPESDTWYDLPSPNRATYCRIFAACHEKLFVINFPHVEVFDTNNHEWREVFDLPISLNLPKAIVLNDHLYVFESYFFNDESVRKTLCWNDFENQWEVLDDSTPFKILHLYRVCELDDAKTIRLISKERPITELVSSDFT